MEEFNPTANPNMNLDAYKQFRLTIKPKSDPIMPTRSVI